MRSAALLFLLIPLACGHDATTSAAPRACGDVELVVAASDYESSVLCGAPGCVEDTHTTGKDLGSDPMLSSSNGHAFFLARDQNSYFELDPACGTPLKLISLYPLAGTAGQTNPHDVAVAPDGTEIIALYNVPKLAFVKNGALDGAALDLSSFDPDGNPQAESVRVVAVDGVAKAFVALERLDDHDQLHSNQPSQMLRVDVATRKAEATTDLVGRNPFNAMALTPNGALFLAEPGNPDIADEAQAGIERFDTSTSTTKLLVNEHDLGASVVEVAVSGSCGVAIVAGPVPRVNPTALVSFDPNTGAILHAYSGPVLGPTTGYDLQGLAWRGSTLYVGDRRRGPGGFTVHELTLTGACDLASTDRSILLPRAPVALLPANPK